MMEFLLSIVTPTFNRKRQLETLFDSLLKQTCKQFEWIVVDDGSTDGTEEFYKKLPRTVFEKKYIKQENGGKHRALNKSHSYLNGEIVLILDSDDYLTDDAVETVINDWILYRNRKDICGMSYMKGEKDGTLLSKKNGEDVYIDDDINYRVNKNIEGDRCEVLRTDLLKIYRLPEHDGEKFMSEGWLWTNLAKKYKTVYRNRVIYICEYLSDGLTKSGRRLRMDCPNGMMDNCQAYFDKKVALKIQLKEVLLYSVYSRIAGQGFMKYLKDTRICKPLNIIVYPLGRIVLMIWELKY